jgi:hypothetical protein
MENLLKFQRTPHPENYPSSGPKNATMQYFSGEDVETLDSLVREVIQNSLDHPLDKSAPVKINFKEFYILTKEIPCIVEISETIDALIQELERLKKEDGGQVSKLLEYYNSAKESVLKDEILALKISDYNTKGLRGSLNDETTILGRFLGGAGYFDDASNGGGSGGLGKYAPFKFSSINFCYYSSFNIDKEFLYYGWGNNFNHTIDGVEYMPITSVGASNDVLKLKEPYKSGFLSKRKTEGTDVFVLGQQEHFDENWIDLMTKSVLRNFFGAIIDNNLTVEINNREGKSVNINSSNILDYISLLDKNMKRSPTKNLPPERNTYESITAYSEGVLFNSLETKVKTPILGECEVRIIQNDDFSKYFTYMRGPKMLIYSQKLRHGDLPYTGVFTCLDSDGFEGNKLLRNIEDSHHKNWPFKNSGEERKIKREISGFISYCIEEVASHESEDSFGLKGVGLFVAGDGSNQTNGDETTDVTDKETSVIYPKSTPPDTKTTKIKREVVIQVDGNGKRKKTEPLKPRYKKTGKGSRVPKKDSDKKREYNVSEFDAQIFKNDLIDNEYHLYVNSNTNTDVAKLKLTINKAGGISFIDEIKDENNNIIERNDDFKESDNAFKNLNLLKGVNKFIVKTKMNNKLEIIIE